MLFFSGHKMAPKRYQPYFPGIVFEFDPLECKDSCTIITHSVGLVRAIVACKTGTIPAKIVALDPPDISPAAIIAKLEGLPPELVPLYKEFLGIVDRKPLNIVCWRNAKYSEFGDSACFRQLILYPQDTHRPYEIKSLRDAIIREATRT